MSVNVNWVPGITLEEMEKQCILAAFRFYRGNKTTTAQVLGIAIRTLDNKLEKYDGDARREQDRYDADKRERETSLAKQRGILTTQYNGLGSSNQIPVEQSAPNGPEADTRVHVQPPVDLTKEPVVSMSERQKVQGVLPKQASRDSQRRGR